MARSLRGPLLWIHRWIGLTLGLFFAVVGLSGSLLYFQPQFFRWAHGDLIPAGLSQETGSIDRWVAESHAAVPDLMGPIAIWLPHVDHNVSDAGMVVYAGRPPGGLGHMGIVGVLVAPATGNVLGVVDIDRSPAYAPIFLHRDLWAGAAGRVVSGIMAIAVLVMLSVGLYLWWPPLPRIVRKLSIRPWRRTLARATPMHEWIGIWTLAILLVLTATGLALVQPTWVDPTLTFVAGPDVDAPVPGACTGPIGYQAAVDRAQTLAPGGRLREIVPADETMKIWQIAFAVPGKPSPLDDTHVHADLACGTVAVESTASTRTRRHALEIWLSGLHDGTAFGKTGEILVSIVGLAPVVLAWSGVLMWWRKRRVRVRKRVDVRVPASTVDGEPTAEIS